jgi:hypothetical protein
MNLESLFPPTLIRRMLDDLGAIAAAGRRLPELERGILQGVGGIQDRPRREDRGGRAAARASSTRPGRVDRQRADLGSNARVQRVLAHGTAHTTTP